MQHTAPKYGSSKQNISISQFHGGLSLVGIFYVVLFIVVSRRWIGWHHEKFNWDVHLNDGFFPHECGFLLGWLEMLIMHICEIRRHGSINFRISLFVKPLLVLFTKNQHFLDSGEILDTLKINILQMQNSANLRFWHNTSQFMFFLCKKWTKNLMCCRWILFKSPTPKLYVLSFPLVLL